MQSIQKEMFPNKKKVVYILYQFPVLSETFIQREIDALREVGVPLSVVSIKKGEKGVEARGDFDTLSWRRLMHACLCGAFMLCKSKQRQCIMKLLKQMITANGGCVLNSFRRLLLGIALAKSQAVRQADVLHAHFAGLTTDCTMVAAALRNLPFSMSVHARDLYVTSTSVLALEFNASARIFVCTNKNEAYIHHLFENGYADKTVCAHHGVVTSGVEISTKRNDFVRIVVVARLVPKKGIAFLLDVLKILRDEGESLSCAIIGDGPLYSSLLQKSREVAIDDEIEFRGRMDHVQTLQEIRDASMLVQPSIISPEGDRDGLPNAVLEAMVSAVPVIVSDASAASEAVRDEVDGLVIPASDEVAWAKAISRLLHNASERHRMGLSGYERVKQDFDINKNIAPLISFFEE